MLKEAAATCDGASLARSVRTLASRARRALNSPPDPQDSRELLRAIASVEQDGRPYTSDELSRWLANLRVRVETHARSAG